MKQIVALFRGINVGGRNLVPMKSLIPLFESNNCHNVKTYIQSGENIEKCLGTPATGRNLNTVNKLAGMLEVI